MSTFAEFLTDAASQGQLVNTMFEERLFALVGVLHRISDVLSAAGIPYELIGGLAVLLHVERVNPEYSSLTRDVDLLVQRADLERIKHAAAQSGFRYRHTAGVDMLLYGESDSARSAVHLLFSGEKVRPGYLAETPPIQPERLSIQDRDVLVVPLVDLVRMKLTSFRLKDQVHIQSLLVVGLITADVEAALSPELLARLQQVRESE